MDIRKAVITAASPGQRTLPLQTLVDRDGKTKTALEIIVGEALNSGAEDICVVIHPGDADTYRGAAGPHGKRLQLVEVASAEACAVSAVQATHESKLPYYGAAGGRLAENRKGLYLISEVMEKPSPTVAEQRLIVPGLRAGHYLCFFGMHVLTPAVMELLGADMAEGRPASLSQTLAKLGGRERYLACELQGRRFDIGLKYGLLTAQLALALSSPARSEVLASLVELLAQEGP
jgi:UTP--glucose-1-phosphate uridylyltransferase